MKKLLLLPLVAIGLALVPAKQADAQVSVGVGGVGVGFGYPAYRYGLRISGIWVLPTELLQLLWRVSILSNYYSGRPKTRRLTGTISIIIRHQSAVGVRLTGWLGAIPSQLFLPEAESSPVKPDALTGERTKCANTLPDSTDYSPLLGCPRRRRISSPVKFVVRIRRRERGRRLREAKQPLTWLP